MFKGLKITGFFIIIFSFVILQSLYGDKGRDLLNAAKLGNVSKVKRLLDEGADVNSRDKQGATALMFASDKGYVKIVKLLLKKGADVNAKTDKGATALIEACYKGRKEIAKMLIDKGADVNAKTKHGVTALKIAEKTLSGKKGHEKEDYKKIVEMLKKAGAKE